MSFFKEGSRPGKDQIFNRNYKMHLPKLFNMVIIKDLISKIL